MIPQRNPVPAPAASHRGIPAGGGVLAPRTRRMDRVVILLGICAVSAAAWIYMVVMHVQMDAMMAGHHGHHAAHPADGWMPPTGGAAWSPLDFWLTFSMWTVMMTAMMLPSSVPMVTLFTTLNRQRHAARLPYVPTFVFVLGYLLAWTGFSAAATLLQWPLHLHAALDPMMNSNSGMLTGALMLLAGVYQLTPLKNACLSKCQTPLGFLLTRWRDGTAGALSMGFRHGLYCIGCCWALMLLMFAAGVMNLLWMVLITLFTLIEKTLSRHATLLRYGSGILLLGLGLWTLLA